MSEYDKAALDAMTDGAITVLRDAGLFLLPLHREYADKVAGYLAVQFAGVPELPRIVLACAQMMAALGAEEINGALVVGILGRTGLQLQDGEAPRA
jgi:hypothetical protein